MPEAHIEPGRTAAVQARIDQFLLEIAELQRPRIRRHVGNLVDYYAKYEPRALTVHTLVFESWKAARCASRVADALAIADEAEPDDPCVATRLEINMALRKVCIEEVRAALIEEAEIDRLAQEDAR